MAGPYKGLTIKLGADASELSAALRKAESDAQSAARHARNLNNALKLDPGNTKLASAAQKALGREIEATRDKLQALNRVKREFEAKGAASDDFEKLEADIVRCTARLEQLNARMDDLSAPGRLTALGSGLEGFGKKIGGASASVAAFGSAYAQTVSLGIVAGTGLAVKAAVDLDTSLTNVKKTVNGTEEEYRALKDAAVAFSETNAVSAAEILDIQALGAQLGFSIDELQEFGEVVSGLDIATNMSAEQAATEMAQFANITGMAHGEIENYASAIVGLGNSMATTEADISSMSMRVAAAGSAVGMSEADILGLSAALSSLGIEAEAGGSAVSTVLSNIDKDVATNSASLQKWADVAGMSAQDFAAAWEQDAMGAFQKVVEGLGETENISVALEELGISELRQIDMMKRLAGDSDLLADAVRTANGAWGENTALSNEVANRNESLAAKFEILKNRVVAIAAEVGGPLADALLDAVDAMEPLFGAIADGAEAFSNMSESQQRAVLGALAATAALGPLLSMAGNVGMAVQGAGAALKAVGGGLDGLSAKAADGSTALGKVSGRLSGISGMGAAATAGLFGLAAAGAAASAAFFAGEWAEHAQRMSDLEVATSGAAMAMTDVGGANAFGDVMRTAHQAVDDTTESVNSLLSSISSMSEGFAATRLSVAASSASADAYMATIERLAGNVDGNAQRHAELKAAVEGYNSVTGSAVSIVDEETGALSSNTEELRANTEEWKANQRAKAYQEQATATLAKQVEVQAELTQAQADYNQAVKERDQYAEGSTAWELANANVNEAKANVDDLKASYDALGVTYEELNAQAAVLDAALADVISSSPEVSAALLENGLSAAGFSDALSAMGVTSESFSAMAPEMQLAYVDAFAAMTDAAGQLGLSTYDLASQMAEAGISMEDVAAIGSESFARLYEEAGGDMGLLKSKVDELAAAQVGDKHTEVTDDGTSEATKEKLADLDGKQVANKHFTVGDGGTSAKAKSLVAAVADARIPDKSFTVTAIDNAKDTLKSIRDFCTELANTTVSIGAAARYASGGIAIPKHADGGFSVATQPTLTSAGWVGEDGWEAIVPLSNARYVTPFAKAVARQIPNNNDVLQSIDARLAWLGANIGPIIADSAPVTVESERDFARRVRRVSR